MIGQAHRRDFSCHLFHTKRTHWTTPATSNSVLTACGATDLVSRGPFKFHRCAHFFALLSVLVLQVLPVIHVSRPDLSKILTQVCRLWHSSSPLSPIYRLKCIHVSSYLPCFAPNSYSRPTASCSGEWIFYRECFAGIVSRISFRIILLIQHKWWNWINVLPL